MDSTASLGYRKEKLINYLNKYVARLGFASATSIGYSNYLAIDQKEKLIKILKKNNPSGIRATVSCIAGG